MIKGTCPSCHRKNVRYDRDRIEVLECPTETGGCGWFITSKDRDYNRVHNQAFPAVTADEQQDRRAAQIERVLGNMTEILSDIQTDRQEFAQTLNDRADRRLFEGMQMLAVGGGRKGPE